jgi:hypothetical protein
MRGRADGEGDMTGERHGATRKAETVWVGGAVRWTRRGGDGAWEAVDGGDGDGKKVPGRRCWEEGAGGDGDGETATGRRSEAGGEGVGG